MTRAREPRSGVTVRISETGMLRGSAVSRTDGTFEIPRVGQGPYEIEVHTDSGKSLSVDGVSTETGEDGDPRIEVAILRP